MVYNGAIHGEVPSDTQGNSTPTRWATSISISYCHMMTTTAMQYTLNTTHYAASTIAVLMLAVLRIAAAMPSLLMLQMALKPALLYGNRKVYYLHAINIVAISTDGQTALIARKAWMHSSLRAWAIAACAAALLAQHWPTLQHRRSAHALALSKYAFLPGVPVSTLTVAQCRLTRMAAACWQSAKQTWLCHVLSVTLFGILYGPVCQRAWSAIPTHAGGPLQAGLWQQLVSAVVLQLMTTLAIHLATQWGQRSSWCQSSTVSGGGEHLAGGHDMLEHGTEQGKWI